MKKVMTLVVALVLSQAAMAQQAVNERAAADADGRVEISNVAGKITVQGWDRNEVEVTGTLSKEVERLEFKAEGKRTLIKVIVPKNTRKIGPSDLKISLPAGSRLKVSGVSSDIHVRGLNGEQDLESVSGDIDALANGKDLDAETVSGDVIVQGAGQASRLTLSSVSGDIKATGVAGEINATVVSGDIEVAAGTLSRAELNSVNGTLELTAQAAPDARFKLETVNGSVDLTLAGEIDAEFDVETFNGSIKNCFGPEAERTSDYAPGRSLKFVQGNGSARISIDTLNGRIKICGSK